MTTADASAPPSCDLVMKGGITSGVVYPKLIARLAGAYRFRNIGGTSAGAIAAAGCAAAEYGRRYGHPRAFERLSNLPKELSTTSGTPPASKLFKLFQPAPEVEKHFAVLVSMLNAGPWRAVAAGLLTMLRQFFGFALLGFAIALLLVVPVVTLTAPAMGLAGRLGISLAILAGWGLWTWLALRRLSALSWFPFLKWLIPAAAFTFAVLALLGGAPVDARLAFATAAATLAALLSLAVALAAAGAKFVTTLIAGVHTNFYGMCSGRTMRAGDGDGLTDWLTGYFDALAGPRPGNHPLTFGDLWGDAAAADGDPRERQINLEVMTTAISQQLCYSIPFREGTPALYYDEQEWERLFPPAVMACLKDARRAAAGDDEVPIPVVSAAGRRLRRLPANRDLPVVVAVRMSLSFPILLSAVPLYAIDWSRTHNQTARERARTQADSGGEGESVTLTATRVWFSDGGIASNMPLHFFDAPLPGHPTFAVNLKKPHPDHPVDAGGRVYLPDSNVGGRLRYWPEPSDTAPARGLIGFLLGIVNTMQNWRDEIQFPYPGYRDRIVQISQRDDEGGLNLNMPEKHITALSDAGETAAQVLIDRFHPAGAQAAEGWANHEEVRLTTFLGLIERMGLSLHARLADGTWADVTARVVAIGRYSERDGERANTYLDGLRALGDAMQDGPGLADKALKPRAELRISPRI